MQAQACIIKQTWSSTCRPFARPATRAFPYALRAFCTIGGSTSGSAAAAGCGRSCKCGFLLLQTHTKQSEGEDVVQ